MYKDKIIKKLQECAVSLDKWCLQNKMVLSIEKTKTLFISNREKSVQINTNCNLADVKIGNTIIDEVNSTKLLGVNVDNTLSWTMQVAQVKKCTSYRLFLFRTIRKYLPLKPGLNIMIIMLDHSLNIVAQFGVSARKKIRLKSLKSKRKQQD